MSDSPTDEQLLRRFLAEREESALGELAGRYEQRMLGLARGMMGGDRSRAMDAVQETWMRIIRYGSSFNGHASFGTWAYRILVNECHRLRKRAEREAKAADQTVEQSTNDSDRQETDKSDAMESMRSLMAGIADAKRDVLLLCYHHGLTHAQAADILEIPLGTLKSRLNAALEELREQLRGKGES